MAFFLIRTSKEKVFIDVNRLNNLPFNIALQIVKVEILISQAKLCLVPKLYNLEKKSNLSFFMAFTKILIGRKKINNFGVEL